MKKKLLLFVILLINISILTGCWNYQEIDKSSIIAGVAVDKNADGGYLLTVELVDLHEGGRKVKSKKLQSSGTTILDAIRNALKITAPKLYWGHIEIVVISREVAEEGITEILDMLSREPEPRLNIDLLVAKEGRAEDMLNAQSVTTAISSYEINTMLDAQRHLSKSYKVQVYEFINALSNAGVSPVLPAIKLIENQGRKTSMLSGNAVFRGDRCIGYIDDEDSKHLRFVLNNIKGGILTINEGTGKKTPNISLKIYKSKTSVKPVYTNGNISMNIDIKTHVSLSEYGSDGKFNDQEEVVRIKRGTEKKLIEGIKKTILKVQEEYGVDIFGFGKKVKENKPSLWKKIGPQWGSIFKDLKVNINAKIEIDNSGLLLKPIKQEVS